MNDQMLVNFENTSIAFKSKTNAELRKMYLLFASMNSNMLVRFGTAVIKFGLDIRLPIKSLIKNTLFNQFCGGETIEDCALVIKKLSEYKIGTVLDYSVEGEKSEIGFENTTREILRTIENAGTSSHLPFCVFKVTGIASSVLLEKIQSKQPLSEEETKAFKKVMNRLNLICKTAYEKRVKIFVDAEESWIQDPIDEATYEMMKKYNQQEAIVYNTYQMYRADMLCNLKSAYKKAIEGNYFMGAKLVRGAYMEKERERALDCGYKDPIQTSKEITDKDFNEALILCLENIKKIGLCAGTHNEQSCYLLMELMKKHNISPGNPQVYFAQLFGMSDHISYNLANAGFNVAKYVPYGPVASVMPYLFRRANENTAIAGQSSREFTLVKKELRRRKNYINNKTSKTSSLS